MTLKHVICLFVLTFPLLATPVSSSEARSTPQIEGCDARIQSLMKEGHFPGAAIAVMRGGQPVHVGTYGMANLADGVPVTSRTVFELASLTKQMTALAIMTLIEQGRLTLESRLVKWVDDAPAAWSEISVGQLLSHTAGLAHRFEKTVDGTLLLEYSREDMLTSAKNTPMIAKPGTDWNYSDQGYFLLGIIIEGITGQSYAEFMQETFFKPLGMRQTHLLDQQKIVPHLAQGYALLDGELQRNRRVWQFALTSHFGVMSSLDDMMRWEAELSNPQVVNRKALEATWEIQRPFDTGTSCDTWGYARGWKVYVVDGHRVLSHGGHSGTAYIRSVDDGLAVIVLTNREDTEEALSPLALGWAAAHLAEPIIPAGGYRCWE
jgi:CubicO group peptidase (beta-lactamase class C family)